MLGASMCVGAVKSDLMVRVGPDAYEAGGRSAAPVA